jgi:nucleoside-diphosphate-sugar epimerase
MVDGIVSTVGKGKAECVPWPADYINVETGDYVAGIDKICRFTGWRPRTMLSEGIKETVGYYQAYLNRYL